MISRRLIRIRVMQAFYAYKLDGISDVEKAEKHLMESLDKTYELYFHIFDLLLELVDYAKWKIEQGKQKYLPTYEDLHPNTKFIDNQVIAQLRENIFLNEYLRTIRQRYNWRSDEDQKIVKDLYDELKKADFYIKYMNNDERSYAEDKQILVDILEQLIYYYDPLYDHLEEKNIFWGDSVDYVILMVSKTIQKFSIGDDMRKPLMTKFRSSEDLIFAKQLLTSSILRQQHYLQILEDHIENWDVNRLAKIDVILLILGIHELLYFEEIPIKVTLNEYIEIAKHYSTIKSPAFINGILDKIVKKFKEENLIVKTGKGLIEK